MDNDDQAVGSVEGSAGDVSCNQRMMTRSPTRNLLHPSRLTDMSDRQQQPHSIATTSLSLYL